MLTWSKRPALDRAGVAPTAEMSAVSLIDFPHRLAAASKTARPGGLFPPPPQRLAFAAAPAWTMRTRVLEERLRMQIEFVPAKTEPAAATAMAVFAFEDGGFSPSAEALDGQLGGAIRRAIAAGRFKGQMGQSLHLPAPTGTTAGRVVVIGAGKQDAFDAKAAEAAAAHAFNAAKDTG